MSENVLPMLGALAISIFNFWVALLNLQFDKAMAKFFVSINVVFGIMNLVVAVKYLLM